MLRILINSRKLKLIEKRVLHQTQHYITVWDDENKSFYIAVSKFLEQDTILINKILRKQTKLNKAALIIIGKPYMLDIQTKLNYIINESGKEVPDIAKIKDKVNSLAYYNFLTNLIGV